MKTDDLGEIADLVEQSFADHVLTGPDEAGVYTCRNPSAGAYWFRLSFHPGAFFLWGDLGEAVWRVGTRSARESVGWAVSSCQSLGYCIEKMNVAQGDGRYLSRETYSSARLRETLKHLLGEGCLTQEQYDAMDHPGGHGTDADGKPDYTPPGAIQRADDYGGAGALHVIYEAAADVGIDLSDGLNATVPDNGTLWQVACLRKFRELIRLRQPACPGCGSTDRRQIRADCVARDEGSHLWHDAEPYTPQALVRRPGEFVVRPYVLLFPILYGSVPLQTPLMRVDDTHPVPTLRGRWNGWGGKVEAGESYADAALREGQEELPWITRPHWEYAGRFGSWPEETDGWEVAVFFTRLNAEDRPPADGPDFITVDLTNPPMSVVPNLRWIMPLVNSAAWQGPFNVQDFHVVEVDNAP